MGAGHPISSPPSAQVNDALGKRSMFWLVIGLGMLVLLGGIGAFTLQQVDDSDYWVDHTRQVIGANQQLLLDIRDAEAAERGYIITGDDRYLEPFNAAAQDLAPVLAKLHQLLSDNPQQQKRLTALEGLINQRMNILHQGVQQRQNLGFAAAEAVVASGGGRESAKQIGDASRELGAEEYGLLEQRSHTRQARVRAGFVAGMVAVLLALATLITAGLDVRRALRQRNIAQQEREESESTSRALFQSAAQGIVIVDRGGRVVMANPAMEKMLGYAEGELVGKPIEVLVPEPARERHAGHREGYFGHPQARPMGVGMDLQARRKDGSTFDAEIGLSYIQSAQGTLAVAFASDISKRKADEKAIRHQGEELRRLAGRMMTAQDDERRRIARDLHDDLSQKLAYLAMDLSKLALKPNSQELQKELLSLRGRAHEASDTVRHISHQLHPSVLDDIGLEAAIEQYCEEFEDRSEIATHFTARDVPDSIPREVASSVYHIFQESLRNVSKHSRAEKVFVMLESVEGVLRLTVKDEGVGLAPEKLQTGRSIGIIGMKERAYLVNGTLSVDSRVGEGTEVTVSVPLAAA
ncbi:MAG TPA: CHASE3 domain-containing protein [Terriglobales bacterium]|nr:CHASE3 domain-containing protein [Terriglobales bacterium]